MAIMTFSRDFKADARRYFEGSRIQHDSFYQRIEHGVRGKADEHGIPQYFS